MLHGPNPESIQIVDQAGGGGLGLGAASGKGRWEEVPAGWGGGGSPGPGAQTKGLPRAGPEAFSYRGTQEVWGQRDPKSYQVRSVSSRVSRQGAFGMHFALGHPRPLLPALWGHWDGTKP